ncbi:MULTISPECIES: hypothetical protein [Pseudomonas]|uniref:Uncharacterized protein n=1 Tax=Pseudomonas fluorescens TaxID=294 RepID=A0A5E6TT18_PSEFL|nr:MULTISPECIES: hypothetical protein [Pseudomonas]VVM96541.1 hypothetical protein PS652_03065 [Pseudomonas fluorescens]
MNFHAPRMLLVALFAFAAVGTASATPMKTSTPVLAPEAPATRVADNPWPSLASMADTQPGPLLAHDDRYRHDHRWHDRRDDWHRENWRREQWRREQARREAERHRYWERHHDRAMRYRYEEDRRYYRR